MKKTIIYILLFALVFSLTGCAGNVEPVHISVDITPDVEVATSTPVPTPTQTATPTPEPTPAEEVSVYVEDLDYEDGDSTIYFSQWEFPTRKLQFTIGGQSYNKGIGMYVKSSRMQEGEGSVSFIWNLDKDYHRISFDMGCEKTLQYDVEKKYGTYNVSVFADNTKLWESGFNDYSHEEIEKSIDIPEGSEKLIIMLTEKRGELGTLNVILGSFKAYYYK